MDIIAANTPREFVLQFDVGTCMEAGADPLAWIKANPGRIKSLHLKDWAPGDPHQEKGYRVLFGEGITPWAAVIATAEAVGGVEFYLMEQEGQPLHGIRGRPALPGQLADFARRRLSVDRLCAVFSIGYRRHGACS